MNGKDISVRVLGLIAVAAASLGHGAMAAEDVGRYGQQLAQVYGTYQAITARKEACVQAWTQTREATEKSYAAWRARHAGLISELDARLAAMIRGASRDEKEYVRNYGKYQGAMVQQREEVKQAVLVQPPGELQALCQSLPQLLASRDSDLEALYAEELKNIRAKPLAR